MDAAITMGSTRGVPPQCPSCNEPSPHPDPDPDFLQNPNPSANPSHTCTVMTPSLPTRSIARAMSFPISSSPFAEMVPTCGCSESASLSVS